MYPKNGNLLKAPTSEKHHPPRSMSPLVAVVISCITELSLQRNQRFAQAVSDSGARGDQLWRKTWGKTSTSEINDWLMMVNDWLIVANSD